MPGLTVMPLAGMPEVAPGDSLPSLILDCQPDLAAGDVVIVTQKVVSKAENRLVPLVDVEPSSRALEFARVWNKEPRVVELVLRESRSILRMERGIMIVETDHGLVCANAGLDMSNCDGGRTACLLPLDPDASADNLSRELSLRVGFHLPVIISDSFGRPWRLGIVNVAVGVSGLLALRDYRGRSDTAGLEMKASVMGVADMLTCAAELVMGKVDRVPVAIVRGYDFEVGPGRATDLVRPREEFLFN